MVIFTVVVVVGIVGIVEVVVTGGSVVVVVDGGAAVAELIECGGGRRWASAEARRHVTQGIDMVARIGIPDRPAAELQDLAHYIVDRQA